MWVVNRLLYLAILLAGLTLGSHTQLQWLLDRETSGRLGWEEMTARMLLATMCAGWAWLALTGVWP